MKVIMNGIVFVVVLTIFILMAAGIYNGSGHLYKIYMQIGYTLRVVLTAGITTALLCAVIIVAGIRMGARIEAKSRVAVLRHELYASMIDFYRRYVGVQEPLNGKEHNEILTGLRGMDSDMALLSSGATLRAHHQLFVAVASRESDQQRLRHLLLQLIRAFRRDLGQAYSFEETKLTEALPLETNNTAQANTAAYSGPAFH